MIFRHDHAMYEQFPSLRAGVLWVDGIGANVDVSLVIAPYYERARSRLELSPESEFPEIQAWRRAFSQMGLKPTQYRCASESLLRRFRKEGDLPSLHPLIDLYNAVSLAYAIPVCAFDVRQISGDLTVRPADGSEQYLSFAGDVQVPEVGEIIFADDAGNAHARRWSNRQSGLSAIQQDTSQVLIVTEALHADAESDIRDLVEHLAAEIAAIWGTTPQTAMLNVNNSEITFSNRAQSDRE